MNNFPRKSLYKLSSISSTILYVLLCHSVVFGANFTRNNENAQEFGVHEIVLQGNGTVANPFTTKCSVTFKPPAGSDVTVTAFYDEGNTWRARVYVTRIGKWNWHSKSVDDSGLHGKQGAFMAVKSNLRGILKKHAKNNKTWMTDDGRTFLNINDTAYRLFNSRDAAVAKNWKAYIEDNVQHGITSIRSAALGGWEWDKDAQFDEKDVSNWPWDNKDTTRYDLKKFQTTDRRLAYLLNTYPDIYVQLILFGLVKYHKDFNGDEWFKKPEIVRKNTLSYMIARWSAFPQIFWLVVNDMHIGEEFPKNSRFVREVGTYFKEHEPWVHLMSTGPNRTGEFTFTSEDDMKWCSYIHLEHEHQLAGDIIEKYNDIPLHVFLGEDRYEQDHSTKRDPFHMDYWQRRLFWACMLSGGSTNYGGRFPFIHPYDETAAYSPISIRNVRMDGGLKGLDNVIHIKNFIEKYAIDISKFVPSDDLCSTSGIDRVKCMRNGQQQFIIYHPNAAGNLQTAQVNTDSTAEIQINLSNCAEKTYNTLWYRVDNGYHQDASNITGGKQLKLISPWKGIDVVLYLYSQRKNGVTS